MNRKGGVAVTAMILAILGVSYRPRQATESNRASDTGKRSTKPLLGARQKKRKPKLVDSCQQIATRLGRFYAGESPVPDSCLEDPSAPNNTSARPTGKLRFVLAIVPNPIQTHLPLMFDRAIEAIQQAAQDATYAYDSSWFPWNQTEKSYDLLDDQQAAGELESLLEKQPGVLVFRSGLNNWGVDQFYAHCEKEIGDPSTDPHCLEELENEDKHERLAKPYEKGLVVFVVGEQPTGGIRDLQFKNALQWMHALGADQLGQKLCILGPTFSGSLQSLALELEAEATDRQSKITPNVFRQYAGGIVIHSGTTSSETSVHWFQLFLEKWREELGKTVPKSEATILFRTFYESDSLMTDRFLYYLHQEGYRLNKVAILSEDETAYGTQRPPLGPPSTAQEPIYLYYPRDIATLRSAYEQQSIFSAGKQQTNAPGTTLRGDLSEPSTTVHDTARTYAGQLTPLAQEAILFGITNLLEAKHIEFVILKSSNPLDQLFLSEFLRRSYPSGRVVIDGSDLLFRRGMQGSSLRGVLLLSPYPLLSWTQDSSPKFHGLYSGRYRVFARDSSESLYIAARVLFDPDYTDFLVPISDYAPPRWALKEGLDDRRPATWVSVVGHRQFWPVAVLNSNTQPNGPKSAAGKARDRSLLKPEIFPPTGGPSGIKQPNSDKTGLPGEMVGLLTFCLMLGLWHVYCCANGSIMGSPRVRAYFAPIPRVQHVALIFLGSLIIGYLGVLLVLSLQTGIRVLAAIWMVPTFLAVSTLVVFGFLGCLTNYRLPVLTANGTKDQSMRISRWRRWALWLLPLLLILLALLRHYILAVHLDLSNLRPTFWRIIYLRSGVSPLLPQVLLLFGLYAWFSFTLQGLSLFGADRPVLPWNKDLPQLDLPLGPDSNGQSGLGRKLRGFRMFSREDAGNQIEAAAIPLTHQYLKSLVLFLPVTLLVSAIALGDFTLRSLGDRSFGTLIFLCMCLCIAVMLADTLQFLRTWSRLHQLLIFLDRLRLRRTLGALEGLSWDSVWKMSGNILEQRYSLISRQFESMRNLKNTLEAWNPTSAEEIQGKVVTLKQLGECERRGAWFAEWYVNLCAAGYLPPIDNVKPLQEFQEEMAAAAGCVMQNVIRPAWFRETRSLILKARSSPKASPDGDQRDTNQSANPGESQVQAAEEFFVLPYIGLIQNTTGRIRSIAMSILALFVATTLAMSSYPFDPLPVIGGIFLVTFLLVGATVVFVYAEMHRDATLSHITQTGPGELGLEFWGKLFAFGVGPLIGLLTTLFPSMTDFVISWLQPGAQVIK